MKRINAWILGVVVTAGVVATVPGYTQIPNSRPVVGLKDNTPSTTVLRSGTIVVAPGQVIEDGDIVIQDDMIRKVGSNQKIPAGAKIIELQGRFVYAGFIDAYRSYQRRPNSCTNGAPYWNDTITPQLSVAEVYSADDNVNSQFRSQGFAARVVAPSTGIIRGLSALVTTGTGNNNTVILKPNLFQHIRLTVPQGRGRDQYPNSPMGAVALASSSSDDGCCLHLKSRRANQSHPGNQRPERNDALASLDLCLMQFRQLFLPRVMNSILCELIDLLNSLVCRRCGWFRI